jgi:farnesyl-diphosphate farnesyltransferase
LSLIVLPCAVRQQVSLAYLFCRIADTIADTRMLPQYRRQEALATFREQFLLTRPAFTRLKQLQRAVTSSQASEGEQQLLAHLSDCFWIFLRLSEADQQRIRELVLTLTQGMEMDLRYFPGETAATARALPDLSTLEQYTYYVAGVVGEFWTKIHTAHLPALQRCDSRGLCSLGVRFGKGLQMTNILKDLAQDLHHGRCYLPANQLEHLRVGVGELCRPESLGRIRPLITALAWHTLEHLDCARDYILRLPRRAFRLRLSCMWPLLFAVQTLDVVCKSEALLCPDARVKISRQAVYRTMCWSLWCLTVPGLFARYYGHLRQRLTTTLWGYEAPMAPL